MSLARVVSFENVNRENLDRIKESVESGEPPEGMPPAEFLLLHDAAGDTSLAIVIVESEDDYRRADEILGGMPASETAGHRTAVTRYEVVAHASTS
jgi:hypothetical protein